MFLSIITCAPSLSSSFSGAKQPARRVESQRIMIPCMALWGLSAHGRIVRELVRLHRILLTAAPGSAEREREREGEREGGRERGREIGSTEEARACALAEARTLLELAQKRLVARISCGIPHGRLVNCPQALDVDVVHVAIFGIELGADYASFVHLWSEAQAAHGGAGKGRWKEGKSKTAHMRREHRRDAESTVRRSVRRWLTTLIARPLMRDTSKSKTGRQQPCFCSCCAGGWWFRECRFRAALHSGL